MKDKFDDIIQKGLDQIDQESDESRTIREQSKFLVQQLQNNPAKTYQASYQNEIWIFQLLDNEKDSVAIRAIPVTSAYEKFNNAVHGNESDLMAMFQEMNSSKITTARIKFSDAEGLTYSQVLEQAMNAILMKIKGQFIVEELPD